MADNSSTPESRTLAEQIAAFQAGLLPQLPAGLLATLQEGGRQVAALGIEQRARRTGDRIPDFVLPNGRRQPVAVRAMLARGPLVISFYRGAWCPYCNLEIRALAQHLHAIRAAGADLLAISPQTPDLAQGQVMELGLEFDVVSDAGNAVAHEFGLVFTLPEVLRPVYAAWGVDLAASQGNDAFELPVPATYIVDQHGIIRYHFIDSDYTRRLEPTLILERLAELD